MYRKSSGSYGTRTSQPMRLSALLLEAAEETKRPEVKKSMIPVARGSSKALSKASSAEDVNEYGRPSSFDRESTAKRRVLSADRLSGCSTITPKVRGQTPGSVITTTRRTARKDTRALTDRAFQNAELSKVREFLVSEGLLEPLEVDDISSKMTLKLFVSVMRALLLQFFPGFEITMSNYVEAVTSLLKKLKYPGKVVRSWLITANATHSWQHVLGVMSWLVNLLSASQVSWMSDEDNLEPDKIAEMHSFNARRYREWTFCKTEAFVKEDDDFFESLTGDRIMYLKEERYCLQETIEDLEKQVDNSTVLRTIAQAHEKQDLLKHIEANIENEKAKSRKLSLEFEELVGEIKTNEKKIQDLNEQLKKEETLMKKIMQEFGSMEALSQSNIKLKSELVHMKHRIEYQKTLIDENSQQIYKTELSMARERTMLDKEEVNREALVRELICHHPEMQILKISFHFAHPDAPKVMKEYRTLLEKTLASRTEAEEAARKKLDEHNRAVNMLKEELKKIEGECKKVEAKWVALEEQLKEVNKTGTEEVEGLNLQIPETENFLKQICEDVEAENTDIAEKEDTVRALEEEIRHLQKDNEEASKTYKQNLEYMTQKLEDNMKRVIDAYKEHFGS